MTTKTKTQPIRTIGYEGRSLADLIEELQADGVDCLVDVRLNPWSRKRGFSKSQLSAALDEFGIEYVHLRELGNPKEIRSLYYEGRIKAGQNKYRKHLLSEGAEALEEVAELSRGKSVALLCFERCVDECHRSVIADELARKALPAAVHL